MAIFIVIIFSSKYVSTKLASEDVSSVKFKSNKKGILSGEFITIGEFRSSFKYFNHIENSKGLGIKTGWGKNYFVDFKKKKITQINKDEFNEIFKYERDTKLFIEIDKNRRYIRDSKLFHPNKNYKFNLISKSRYPRKDDDVTVEFVNKKKERYNLTLKKIAYEGGSSQYYIRGGRCLRLEEDYMVWLELKDKDLYLGIKKYDEVRLKRRLIVKDVISIRNFSRIENNNIRLLCVVTKNKNLLYAFNKQSFTLKKLLELDVIKPPILFKERIYRYTTGTISYVDSEKFGSIISDLKNIYHFNYSTKKIKKIFSNCSSLSTYGCHGLIHKSNNFFYFSVLQDNIFKIVSISRKGEIKTVYTSKSKFTDWRFGRPSGSIHNYLVLKNAHTIIGDSSIEMQLWKIIKISQ